MAALLNKSSVQLGATRASRSRAVSRTPVVVRAQAEDVVRGSEGRGSGAIACRAEGGGGQLCVPNLLIRLRGVAEQAFTQLSTTVLQ
jgi:hypothetical protein